MTLKLISSLCSNLNGMLKKSWGTMTAHGKPSSQS